MQAEALIHYLVVNMFQMLKRLFAEACDLFVELFHGLYCSGTMCVGVTFVLVGVVWYPDAG